MPLLIFGATGQVATELRARCPQARVLSRSEADLADPEACAARVADLAPEAVINAAAYTAVDRAEEEESLATIINADAPAAMARACAAQAIPFVHISTDYVFDGAGEAPFAPDAPVAPLGAYGRSKLAGERGVTEAGGVYAVLRTSWVFSAHGTNFLKTMLRLGAERDELRIIADQIGGPTPAGAIAEACLAITAQLAKDPAKRGVYHFAGAPEVSWAGFARAIFEAAKLDCAVTDIPSSDYPTPARRPLNSRLDTSTTEARFGIARPDWRAAMHEIIAKLERDPA